MARRFRNTIRRPDQMRRKGGTKTPSYDEELDLHGMTVDEALSDVDQFLYQHPGETILIIHGKGTGILKKAVRDFLKENQMVQRLCLGEESGLPGKEGVVLVVVERLY